MSIDGFATQARFAAPLALHMVEEINHRVTNEFAEAIAMLGIAARGASDEAALELVKIADRLQSHAKCHRALLPPRGDARANVATYVDEVCRSFTQASLIDRGIHLFLKTEDVWTTAERCWRIGLIVAELVRNAARHGLAGRPGRILVHIEPFDGCLWGLVRDTGMANSNAMPGRGQSLVRALLSDIGGSARWSFSSLGTLALFAVPISNETNCSSPSASPKTALQAGLQNSHDFSGAFMR